MSHERPWFLMSLHGAWPIDPSSACVTAINTLISEPSGPRKCSERRPFSCSITLHLLSRCPASALADALCEFWERFTSHRGFHTNLERGFKFVGGPEKWPALLSILYSLFWGGMERGRRRGN
uniref:Uncharacterized protein n=1 Tax=Myripristis murdjan TaxID=586833 RepID=A0A668AQ87_9TELE